VSLWTSTRTAPALGALGLAVTVGFLVAIVWSHSRPPPALLADTGPGPDWIVAGPCTVERVQDECNRWAAAGWPGCTAHAAAPTDGRPYTRILLAPPPAGQAAAVVVFADGSRAIALQSTDGCSDYPPRLAHELGHWPIGLRDDQYAGSIMNLGHREHDEQIGGLGRTYPRSP